MLDPQALFADRSVVFHDVRETRETLANGLGQCYDDTATDLSERSRAGAVSSTGGRTAPTRHILIATKEVYDGPL